jgi:hypothetical protein
MTRIFISHSPLDDLFVNRLINDLRRHSIHVFVDHEDCDAPGLYRDIEVFKALTDCTRMIAVVSTNSLVLPNCLDEWNYFLEHDKVVIPVWLSGNMFYRLQRITYEDFRVQYDEPLDHLVRFLTEKSTGYASEKQAKRSPSWQDVTSVSDDELLKSLTVGLIPAAIARELGNWIIVNQLWRYIKQELLAKANPIIIGTPQTAKGVQRQIAPIRMQLAERRDMAGVYFIDRLREIVDEHISHDILISDLDDSRAGEQILATMVAVRKFLIDSAVSKRDFLELMKLTTQFDFNVAEKMRDLVTSYELRSKPHI